MKDSRSASQVLFGFLPEQTVDLKSGVWKVKDWRRPLFNNDIDEDSLRREIIRQASPWRAANLDGGFVNQLEGKGKISVVTLDPANGVEVEPFPRLWVCKGCNRVHDTPDAKCKCRATAKGQLFFVGFHDRCGALREPWVPKCPTHKERRVKFPGTASAAEIIFDCPTCSQVLRKGFGHNKCECGNGNLNYQPHRASSVYAARSVVIVNPPSKERIKTISGAGGAPKALSWVIDGMKTRTVEAEPNSRESIRRQLLAAGIAPEVVETMIAAGAAGGALQEDKVVLPAARSAEAEAEAVTIALATLESRIQREDLVEGTSADSELGVIYRANYKDAMQSAGIHAIDLIEKFPVLTGHFGYTRGDHEPGRGRLIPYKGPYGQGQGFRVYADLAETEALLVRLDPQRVARWLTERGFELGAWTDDRTARVAIIEAAELPAAGDTEGDTLGDALLELIHSYAHRFLRIAAVHAGIDRNSLSELLVPLHLGFFIYAAAKGDFVLGGLQAVFESELHHLVDAVMYEEHRCALDPGCLAAGGACMACLHVGEPSCRYFNRFLGRDVLFGAGGYLR